MRNLEAAWPVEGLEIVLACPICRGENYSVLEAALHDFAFGAAEGWWKLVRCEACGAAYLKERPTPASIGRAYSNYYTHLAPSTGTGGISAWIRRGIANGYREVAYGARMKPSFPLVGRLVAALSPSSRSQVERQAPGLLDVRPGSPGKSLLLDIGAGSGRLLQIGKSAGWIPVGVEPDPVAAEGARAGGVDMVVDDVTKLRATHERAFERIVMSHVIEHVHDPVEFLRSVAPLLRDDGVLWLETPNLESLGYRRFGGDWRGLEPPRHLVLFDHRSLELALRKAGFNSIKVLPPRHVAGGTFEGSAQIRKSRLAGQHGLKLDRDEKAGLESEVRNAVNKVRREPALSEYLTVEARC